MSAAPRVGLSIVIVTYNSRAHIGGCLSSLIEDPPRIQHEIVMIDNASTDETAGFVRDRWASVDVIHAPANIGFARANNLGIRRTSGGLVLLLNPDTVVLPGAIDTLIAALETRPDAAIAGPRLVDRAGRAELSFGAMLSPFNDLRQKMLVRGADRDVGIIRAYVERATRQPRDVDWVSGAAMLVRRGDAEAVGLLDERYFMYAEDVDFCAAVRARGRAVLFAPAAEVVHLRGQSRAAAAVATEDAYRRSQLAFYEKHHPRWTPVLRIYLKLRGILPDTSIEG